MLYSFLESIDSISKTFKNLQSLHLLYTLHVYCHLLSLDRPFDVSTKIRRMLGQDFWGAHSLAWQIREVVEMMGLLQTHLPLGAKPCDSRFWGSSGFVWANTQWYGIKSSYTIIHVCSIH